MLSQPFLQLQQATDPCRIANCHGIRKEPRDLLRLIPGRPRGEAVSRKVSLGRADRQTHAAAHTIYEFYVVHV